MKFRRFFLLLLLGCAPEQNFETIIPAIAVAPTVLDFGEQAAPMSATSDVYISNNGLAPLDFQLSLTDTEGVFEVLTPSTQSIGSGETLSLVVEFTPTTFLTYEGVLSITSNDPNNPQIDVSLLGEGVDAPMPDIFLDTMTIDFGTVDTSSSDTIVLMIENVGDAPLELGTLTQEGSGAFQLGSDPSLSTISGSDDYPLIIEYTPTQDSGDSGILHIPSNDPDEPEVQVVLLGNGGGDYEYPIANIQCPGEADPPEWVTLLGDDSDDPMGYLPLSYGWTLSDRPTGSQASLTNSQTEATSFFADMAGIYEVQLTVTNTANTSSAPAKCIIDAIPSDELHVELTWDTPSADLDLHLLMDGYDLFESPGDCNYCNANPNWGESTNADDPRLDLDDQGGYGPENINVAEPSSDTYFVTVHYFEDHSDDAVQATVRIYTYGVLAAQESRILFRNDVWEVAQINWPEGSAGILSSDLYQTDVRICY